ncbi:hypothetical protein CFB50_35625 [Burkholderia sp. AU33423]|nr:hypothetical protein CFB50_35625 [Burkholderia sp. AU33423]
MAEPFLSGPWLASFAVRYPDATIDVTVTDEAFDVVARGDDAGRPSGRHPAHDRIFVRIAPAEIP